jgi:RecQ family ATP-dependent DNA helicase
MESLLKKHFGHDEFRPMQLDIIKAVLQNKDALVLMPTGSGKSLCYQIPALQFEGLTLVISPLISLMKDQVDNLKKNNIAAEYINSSLSFEEIKNVKNKIQNNEVKLLYIAPERLALEEFKIFLLTANISLIAIDEAHCISEWGHDFREEYGNLKVIKGIFPNAPVIALTATATPIVREDILKQLSLKNPEVFISSVDRENLNLIVTPKKDSFNKILSLIKKHKNKPTIIYCFSRNDTEKISQRLKDNGHDALPYHAGLSDETRKHNQDRFIQDKVNIIVATIAFGMGIDKPDIRLIIHQTFSKSIEGYYQEIGRAGRDGLPSDCVLFYSWGDKKKHEYFLRDIQDESIKKISSEKLDKMMSYCENHSCRRKNILRYFGEQFSKSNCSGCDICLNLPEIEGDRAIRIRRSRPIREKVDIQYDLGLFENLRSLRKQIANERKVPSFVVFSDFSLMQMASIFPKNENEFLGISGVGQAKLIDFGDLFLKVINDYVAENNIALSEINNTYERRPRALSSTYQDTKEMVLKKCSIKEIASIHRVKESRIVYHIEKLIENGEELDVDYLMPSNEIFQKIKSAFDKLGFEKLKPIYDYLNEAISYDSIRLVRAALKFSGKISTDDKDKTLKEKLLEWRNGFGEVFKLYEENKTPAEDRHFKNGWGCVSNKEIDLLVIIKPKSLSELIKVEGFGKVKLDKYGAGIIKIINENS